MTTVLSSFKAKSNSLIYKSSVICVEVGEIWEEKEGKRD